MSNNDIDIGSLGRDNEQSGNSSLIRDVVEFCGGPDLIELFGGSGSGKSEFAVEVANSALTDADKDVLFIDTERNIGEQSRIGGADYVYVPEWHDIYAYVTRKKHMLSDRPFGENTTNSNVIEDGYDVVVLDSIGFPALIQYGEYNIEDNADQFDIFNELQVITGRLKKYAQFNDALVIVTNQPKSELSGSDNPKPFGDKSIFGFKEVWKTNKDSSRSTGTECSINAFRSRQAGQGKTLFSMKIDDSGTDITDMTDKEQQADEWT
jgi:adenosyl cobinamide kinase/adenosyl cobinamide phosphate guanylyltransferase